MWHCVQTPSVLFSQYPFSLGFSLALCWCLLVCVSRIYMGMHSVLVSPHTDAHHGTRFQIYLLQCRLFDHESRDGGKCAYPADSWNSITYATENSQESNRSLSKKSFSCGSCILAPNQLWGHIILFSRDTPTRFGELRLTLSPFLPVRGAAIIFRKGRLIDCSYSYSVRCLLDFTTSISCFSLSFLKKENPLLAGCRAYMCL